MITLRRNKYKQTMNWLPLKIKGKWQIAILEQFIDPNLKKRFTYMPDYSPLPYSYAIFKIYSKKSLSFWDKIKIFVGVRYFWRNGIVSNQSHPN